MLSKLKCLCIAHVLSMIGSIRKMEQIHAWLIQQRLSQDVLPLEDA